MKTTAICVRKPHQRLRLMVSLLLFGLIFAGQSAGIDPKTVVGMWLFDEGKGEIAKDSSLNGNDGEFVGKPKWVDGKFDKALSLNGKGDVVKITVFGNVAPVSEITIMAWAKVEDVKNQDLFSFHPLVGDNRITIHMPWFDPPDGCIHWQYGKPFAGPPCVPFPKIKDEIKGNWKHWAFVASVSGKFMKMYKDGSEISTGNVANRFERYAGDWHIGGRTDSSFGGLVDEVAVFEAALTADAIKSIMDKGLERALGITTVSPSGKLTTAWGRVKAQY